MSALAMQEIAVEDAVGQILCHDITEIVRGVRKGARFRKGHVVEAADIPVLLSLGKEHLYVWENDGTLLHENEAAEILRGFCQNEGMEASEPKEGKIELRALHDGVFAVDVERFHRLNDFDDIMVACAPQYMAVKKGDLLAGMRVIPLAVKKDLMDEAARAVGEGPIFRLLPYRSLKVGVVTTGSEVAHGRIKDTFTPVLAAKLRAFGLSVNEHRISDDALEHTQAAIEELLDLGMDMVLCTGGMSVDPDDRTPAAIRAAGAEVVTYGAPVLPGAMFLLAYAERDGRMVPVLGLPGCVMYSAATIFDIVLPRILAGERVTRREIRRLGLGGLCLACETCHYPRCTFGKWE